MNTDETVRELRNVQQKHENDHVFTGEIRISDMARDCADLIESLQAQLAKKQSDLDRANGKIQGMLEGTEILERQLTESQRRCRAAVGDLTESATNTFDLCGYCANDGDCPVAEEDFWDEYPGCFEWRGLEAGEGGEDG